MSNSVSRVFALTALLSASVLTGQQAFAAGGGWYVGAGAGVSRLTPETDGSDFTLDESSSAAGGLYLGFDLFDWMGIEAAYTELGEAGLSDDEKIGYSALSLGAVAYVLGETDVRRRQDAWSAYLRLGVNQIDNESDVTLSEENNTAVWLGAGLQWPLNHAWGLRGEINSYDGDAQALMASVYWRPTAERRRGRGEAAITTRPSAPQATTTLPKAQTAEVTPAAVPPESTTTSELADSACAVPAANEPLDAQGCALFSGVQQGVDFIGDTATLTVPAETLLRELARSLKRYPDLLVEMRMHTQSYSIPDRAQSISRERVLAVARYLVGQGVDVRRLNARAFGDSQPRASNETASGRAFNNRLELRVP